MAVEFADLADRELRLAREHAAEPDLERHRLAGVEADLARGSDRRGTGLGTGSVMASAPAQPASASSRGDAARPIPS